MFVEHYREERFEDALEQVNMMNMPNFWGTHMFALAASAALRLDGESTPAQERLSEPWPEFPTHGGPAIEHLVRDKDVAAQTHQELRRVGLDLPGQFGVQPKA